MFDDCIILDVRLGERLVFVRSLSLNLPPSRTELRRMLEDLHDTHDLSAVVRELTGERLDGWGAPASRDEQLDRAAELLASSGCRVLTNGLRGAFTGRMPGGAADRTEHLDSRIPMLSDLGPRAPVETTTEYFVEFVVTTDDGVAIADAQFEVKNTRGFAVRCKSDATGHVRTGVPLDELYGIRVLADIVLPPPPAEPSADAEAPHGMSLGRLADESIDLSVNHRHTLVITRPRAKVVSIDRWVEARPVLLFGTMSQTDDGPTTVRGALRRALTEVGAGELHVVGHADTEGKAGDNEALALERARSVHLYLAGDRVGWAEHAFANADVATLQAALAWAAASCGLACDPGPIDNDWGPATAAALNALRDHAGIDHSQQLGPDDWAAVFDLYDDDLGRILLTDREGVAAARARLNLAPSPTTMGERWPVNAPELADHECPDNRRVDLVMCAADSRPKPNSDELYDGTFLRAQLGVPSELRLRVWVHTPTLAALTCATVLASIAGLGSRRMVAGADGSVITTVLKGDNVRVVRAIPSAGGGTVREFGQPELGGLR
jgi:hypothetical protein